MCRRDFKKVPAIRTLPEYRFWRHRDNIGGMALRGYAKIPTADANKGLGSGHTDGGVDLIFTSKLPGILRNVLLDSSIGVTSPFCELKHGPCGGNVPFPITVKHELRSGLGVVFPSTGLSMPGGVLQAYSNTSQARSSEAVLRIRQRSPFKIPATSPRAPGICSSEAASRSTPDIGSTANSTGPSRTTAAAPASHLGSATRNLWQSLQAIITR